MEKVIAAFGLKSENQLTDKHFGDSLFFDIYAITESGFLKVKRVENPKVEEKVHADPKKAKKIGKLLSEAGVLVAFRMGPNILRMKKTFVPVIVNSTNLNEALNCIMRNLDLIKQELKKQGEKNYITLKVKED